MLTETTRTLKTLLNNLLYSEVYNFQKGFIKDLLNY